jgi:hypothetical protein
VWTSAVYEKENQCVKHNSGGNPDLTEHSRSYLARTSIVLRRGFYSGDRDSFRTRQHPQPHKGRNEGCQSRDPYPNFYVLDGTTFLEGESWLLLGEFYEFESTGLDHKVSTGVIRRMGDLPRDVVVELFACAIDCFDISDRQADILREITPTL